MNQPMNERPADGYSVCTDSAKMAERELSAFFTAITELYGPEQAELSAEEWLREISAMNTLPSSTHEWRRITLNVSTRVASRVNTSSIATQYQIPA